MLISFLVASNSFPHIACGRSLSLPLYLLPTPAHKSDPGARRTGSQLGNKFVASPTGKSAGNTYCFSPWFVAQTNLQIWRVKKNVELLQNRATHLWQQIADTNLEDEKGKDFGFPPTQNSTVRRQEEKSWEARQVGKKWRCNKAAVKEFNRQIAKTCKSSSIGESLGEVGQQEEEKTLEKVLQCSIPIIHMYAWQYSSISKCARYFSPGKRYHAMQRKFILWSPRSARFVHEVDYLKRWQLLQRIRGRSKKVE